MMEDWTITAYLDLLQAGLTSDYEFITVREYLSRDDLPERYVILRHDVDRKPENAAKMAEYEARHDVTSTYYVRTATFDPDLLEHLESLGHEVGYHYEDYVRARGDLEKAHDQFARHLAKFREHVDVDTICMHGNPLSPHDNRDMWTVDGAPGFEEYDLLGEAYLSMDFEDVAYYSDTGRTWRDGALKIKDHTMGEGEKLVNADTTRDLVDLLRRQELDHACLLVHPNRWAFSVPEYVAEHSKDSAVNLVKRGMRLIDYGATS